MRLPRSSSWRRYPCSKPDWWFRRRNFLIRKGIPWNQPDVIASKSVWSSRPSQTDYRLPLIIIHACCYSAWIVVPPVLTPPSADHCSIRIKSFAMLGRRSSINGYAIKAWSYIHGWARCRLGGFHLSPRSCSNRTINSVYELIDLLNLCHQLVRDLTASPSFVLWSA